MSNIEYVYVYKMTKEIAPLLIVGEWMYFNDM